MSDKFDTRLQYNYVVHVTRLDRKSGLRVMSCRVIVNNFFSTLLHPTSFLPER